MGKDSGKEETDRWTDRKGKENGMEELEVAGPALPVSLGGGGAALLHHTHTTSHTPPRQCSHGSDTCLNHL